MDFEQWWKQQTNVRSCWRTETHDLARKAWCEGHYQSSRFLLPSVKALLFRVRWFYSMIDASLAREWSQTINNEIEAAEAIINRIEA